MDRRRLLLLTLTVATSMSAAMPEAMPTSVPSALSSTFDGTLSVLTYNVHGLPWPVAWGRPAQFGRMVAHLRQLRAQGRNPHVMVLQEAFTQTAQNIGAVAGYRYVVQGPSADTVSDRRPNAQMQEFERAASFVHGEGLGKYVGSGLEIASDYPIVAVRRIAYPAFACAGYDCLANKGAMMASVRLPGRPDPVDIVTTHLNSRRASGTADGRSLDAYEMQIGYLTDFIRAVHDPRRALVVAGDFNVGESRQRRAGLLAVAHGQWVAGGRIDDAYGDATRTRIPLSPDAAFSRNRARDWQFFADGTVSALRLQRIDIPFGHDAKGAMLSDHVGYTASFRLSRPASRTVTNVAQAKQSAPVV